MSYMVYRMAPFPMTLNDPLPPVQGHAILWCWISQKRYKIHSFSEILIGTYTRSAQQCYFEWPWVILGDLAKYSMIRSVAWSPCDSWASCTVCILKVNVYQGHTQDEVFTSLHRKPSHLLAFTKSCPFFNHFPVLFPNPGRWSGDRHDVPQWICAEPGHQVILVHFAQWTNTSGDNVCICLS